MIRFNIVKIMQVRTTFRHSDRIDLLYPFMLSISNDNLRKLLLLLIIFDCDGVLVDSEFIANQVESEILTKLGYPITPEECIQQFTGMSAKSVQKMIFETTGINFETSFSDLAILEALKKGLQPLIPSVLSSDLLKTVPKCIASSSPKGHIMMSLHLTKQDIFFEDEYIFTAQQVKNGKPAPYLFLFAAKQMGYEPKNCLVIEDSVAGIQAALAATMPVIGFLGGTHASFSWYKERIQKQNIPIANNASELLSMIREFIKKAA